MLKLVSEVGAALAPLLPPSARAIVAIPANNEAERITACLSALAMQRDLWGGPLQTAAFDILVFANNCSDDTVENVLDFSLVSPHPIAVIDVVLTPEKSNAGWARKMAMDEAAVRLAPDGYILTTDADSCVSPTWFAASMAAFAAGADCVAGYIDALPSEITLLGSPFLKRSRLEDAYLQRVAEIYGLCDPLSHDPWPNHRVSSGASLAVSLDAYLTIGGLPPVPVGEDAALTRTLEDAGFRVRHAMDVSVVTSCRFDGRAMGGAADAMRYRHADAEAPCDGDIETAFATLRRALLKARLRRTHRRDLSANVWLRTPNARTTPESAHRQAADQLHCTTRR